MILREKRRAIHGIVLVNKPKDLTSNAVLQRVKRLFNAQKAGHTGSLDPLATGMLPVCFGEATKFCQYLLDADKCYQVVGRLGIKTNTSDSTGQVIAQVEDFYVSAATLNSVLSEFKGTLQQVPSMFSALKHQGMPLYHFARAGVEIARQARTIHIHALTLDNFDGEFIHLTVKCSKGTYIRNLIEDIGERLGVGAHVTQLHRVYTAGFENEQMFTLEELAEFTESPTEKCLLSMERAVDYLPELHLDEPSVIALQRGQTLQLQPSLVHGLVRLYDSQQQFMGLALQSDLGHVRVKRLLQYSI